MSHSAGGPYSSFDMEPPHPPGLGNALLGVNERVAALERRLEALVTDLEANGFDSYVNLKVMDLQVRVEALDRFMLCWKAFVDYLWGSSGRAPTSRCTKGG